jgi:hypothetical protein
MQGEMFICVLSNTPKLSIICEMKMLFRLCDGFPIENIPGVLQDFCRRTHFPDSKA